MPARAAIIEFSGEDTVGEYLGAGFDDPTAATHRFLADMPGYRGWQWAVVVAACPGADHATISEVVLVPGPTALLAPKWVPWHERVSPATWAPVICSPRPPTIPDWCPATCPAETLRSTRSPPRWAWAAGRYSARGAAPMPRSAGTTVSYGPGRRWPGPPAACAATAASISRCPGRWASMFGVCANELSADGHVVDAEYGCGAHSDTPQPPGSGSPLFDPYDDGVIDLTETAD